MTSGQWSNRAIYFFQERGTPPGISLGAGTRPGHDTPCRRLALYTCVACVCVCVCSGLSDARASALSRALLGSVSAVCGSISARGGSGSLPSVGARDAARSVRQVVRDLQRHRQRRKRVPPGHALRLVRHALARRGGPPWFFGDGVLRRPPPAFW